MHSKKQLEKKDFIVLRSQKLKYIVGYWIFLILPIKSFLESQIRFHNQILEG